MERVTVGRLLHAGYVIEANEVCVLFDPVFEIPFSRNCYPFPECSFEHEKIRALRPSAVFISHVHDDHLCLKSLDLIARSTPIYLYAVNEIYFSMIKALGFSSVLKLLVDETIQVAPSFLVTPRLALDPDVDCLLQIQVRDLNILNVVDSWVDPVALVSMRQVQRWDLVMWPFQTMRELQVLEPSRSSKEIEIPFEWAEVLRELNPKCLIPSSCQFKHEEWSWYNWSLFPISYESFKGWVKKILPDAQYLRLDPGARVELSKDDCAHTISALDFVHRRSQDEVDYVYRPDQKPQSLNEIAAHFPKLSLEEEDRIDQVCKSAIPKSLQNKFNDLDDYFTNGCRWGLKVYFPHIKTYIYDFRNGEVEFLEIENQSSQLLSVGNQWLTEICGSKLWSALQTGETLTSLYMRINDTQFSIKTESKIAVVDILQDPLIRFLFDERQDLYHRHQLKELGLDFS